MLHRDFKLENVLVISDGHGKIADFGLSKLGLFRHGKATTQCGTPFYKAPEMLKKLPYGQGVDWWAVGVIFEMMTAICHFTMTKKRTRMITLDKIICTTKS
jgi:serine/threonine protein kinase